MKRLRPPVAIARSATRQSRFVDGLSEQGVRRPASVLHPVVDPGVTQGDKSSHRGRGFRDFTGVVVILLGTVGCRRRHVGTELDVETADGCSLNAVVTVGGV